MNIAYLKDFAIERNEQPNTVATYIRRHPEEFRGHTRMEGKKMILDEYAQKLLDKVYPLPKPVEIVVDTKTLQDLLEAHKTIDELRQQIQEMTQITAKAEANNRLLEDKESELLFARQETAAVREELSELRDSNNNLLQEKYELQAQIHILEERENNRFWNKIFRKLKIIDGEK